MAEPTPWAAAALRRARRLRCEAIADWWRHAAAGECTVEEAIDATTANLMSLDLEERRLCG
jgi:hypothetical protein